MLLTALASSLLLAAPQSFAIVVSRQVDVGQEQLLEVTSALEEALAAEQIPGVVGYAEAARRIAARGVPSSASCDNERVCLLGLLQLLKADVLIAVDMGHVVDQYALRVIAIEAVKGSPIVERGALLKAKQLRRGLPPELAAFARELKGVLAEWPADPVVVAPEPRVEPPVVVTPARVEPAPPATVVAVKEPSPRRPWMFVSFGVAAAAAATAVAFTVVGANEKGRLEGAVNMSISEYTREDANALAASANRWLTAGLISAVVSLGFFALGMALGLFG